MGCHIFIWKGLMLRLYQLTSIDSGICRSVNPIAPLGGRKYHFQLLAEMSLLFSVLENNHAERYKHIHGWDASFFGGVYLECLHPQKKSYQAFQKKRDACVWTTLPSLPTEVNNNMPKDLWHVEFPFFVEFDNRIKLEIPYTRRWITQSSFSIIWDEMIELGL